MRLPTFFFDASEDLRSMIDSVGLFEWLVGKVQRSHPGWSKEQATERILQAKVMSDPRTHLGTPSFGFPPFYKVEYTLREHLAKHEALDMVLTPPLR